jgi:cutinase
VRRTTDELVRLLHRRSDATVHVEAIRYDATQAPTLAGYLARTADGADMMTSRLRALAARCPSSRFALIGFSQGAQVVHGAAGSMATPLARRVALVAMIADPLNNPADPITRWSYARQPTTGNGRLGSGPPIDADLRPAAISLCVAGDEICNDRGAPGGPASDTHKHFYEQPSAVRKTAGQLDAVLRRNGV